MAATVIVSAVVAVAGQGRPVPPTFSDIAKRAEPAVVSIEAKSRNVQSAPRTNSAPSDSDDILDFFADRCASVQFMRSGAASS